LKIPDEQTAFKDNWTLVTDVAGPFIKESEEALMYSVGKPNSLPELLTVWVLIRRRHHQSFVV